jgi:hypothetical protein
MALRREAEEDEFGPFQGYEPPAPNPFDVWAGEAEGGRGAAEEAALGGFNMDMEAYRPVRGLQAAAVEDFDEFGDVLGAEPGGGLDLPPPRGAMFAPGSPAGVEEMAKRTVMAMNDFLKTSTNTEQVRSFAVAVGVQPATVDNHLGRGAAGRTSLVKAVKYHLDKLSRGEQIAIITETMDDIGV